MTLMGRVRPAKYWLSRGRGIALALGLALGLVAQISGRPARAQTQSPPKTSRARTIDHKSRNFRIPFNIDPADRPLLKDVQLWVSEDFGYHWKRTSVTTPDRPAFTYRAARDGEFWFAIRTLDKKGRLFPTNDEQVEPSIKVIVDTVPPTLIIDQEARRGSQATVRWDVRDDHLDLRSLRLEYQVVGGRDWRQVPIRRPGLIGAETWDAGTAEPLKVRASIMDRAGNVAEAEINVSEGIPTAAGLASNDALDFPPTAPIAQISNDGMLPSPVDGQSGRTSATDTQNLDDDPFHLQSQPPRPTPAPPSAFVDQRPSAPPGQPNPFGDPAPARPANPGAAAGETIVVASPKFPLAYSVEDAGPNGPATVELWVTPDGGRTWLRRGVDADKISPIDVDLGGEGTFGLRTVARAASGLGDTPPAPGDAPHVWVEVDTTPPSVRLTLVKVGTDENVGKIAISWTAADAHLGPKPVQIFWRSDQTSSQWLPVTEMMPNTGQFIWNVPLDVPPRFLLRIDVVDKVGNRNYAETPPNTPVIVDRTKPKSRIIGLHPGGQGGMGPNARPMR